MTDRYEGHCFHRFQYDDIEPVAGAPGAAGDLQPCVEVQPLDDGARDERVALLRDEVVDHVDEDSGAAGLDVEHALDGDQLTRRYVDGRSAARRLAGIGAAAPAASSAFAVSLAPASSAAAAAVSVS